MKRRNQNAPARSADFLAPFIDEVRLQTSGVTVNRMKDEGGSDEEIASHKARWERREALIDRWIRMDCPASGFDAFLTAEAEERKYGRSGSEAAEPASLEPAPAGPVIPEPEPEPEPFTLPDHPAAPMPEAAPPQSEPVPELAPEPHPEPAASVNTDKAGRAPGEREGDLGSARTPFGLTAVLSCLAAGFALALLLDAGAPPVVLIDEGRIAVEAALLDPGAASLRTRSILSKWVRQEGALILRTREALAYPGALDRTDALVAELTGKPGEGAR